MYSAGVTKQNEWGLGIGVGFGVFVVLGVFRYENSL